MALGSSDELTAAVLDSLNSLSQVHKANVLLDSSLALIHNGKYGQEVENYLEVYLRTPNLQTTDMTRALLARANARKTAGERLLSLAQHDFQMLLKLDPTNRDIQQQIRSDQRIHFKGEPACQRMAAEIWERIADEIPRYHLRTWLSVSSFHREIAVRKIFHTLDIYFGEDQENLHRGLDIFDRVKEDPIFARRIKSLRVHWAQEEGEMLDLMSRIFKTALPHFKALMDLEWIGYPEMRADMVQAVLSSHPQLRGLGLIGWHFDAVGVSAFRYLRKFTLRAEDDDGFADMGEVRTVLDENESTLQHLVLGAELTRNHSWDSAFQSITIKNLTHLDLVDTRISHLVFARIAHAHGLQSLTLHGTFDDPKSAAVMFGSSQFIDGHHTCLPHLRAFRFVLVKQDEEVELYRGVARFLKGRTKLRRLDLGDCPWELVETVLPSLSGLRVLGVKFHALFQTTLEVLLRSIPREMVAVNISTTSTLKSFNQYAVQFLPFHSLSFLHLRCSSQHRPKPNLLSEKDFQTQTELWMSSARSVALVLPQVDFIGWHGEHYIVLRSQVENSMSVDIKELPARRRLDCGKGVDLGSDDVTWLERKDVPVDYEMPGLE